MCPRCDEFTVAVEIHGPAQLRRVVGKIRAAVAANTLAIVDRPPQELSIDLPGFLDLDLDTPIPDMLEYRFSCVSCGQCFALDCEAYHGAGGRWAPA